MLTMSLPEELLLLAYRDDGTTHLASGSLDLGLAGAVLLELALARRVDVADGRLIVIDPQPTGDAIVDRAFDTVAHDEKKRKPKDVLGRLTKGLRDSVADRLIDAGILRRESNRVLWVFPRTKLPPVDGVEPVAETDARNRLHAAVAGTGEVAPRTAALASLVRAVSLEREVFSGQPKDEVKRRLREITDGDWAGAAVRKAIEEIEAAVMVAITAATTAAAVTNS